MLKLNEALIVGCLRGTISHRDYRYLISWLDCKEYVKPNERYLNSDYSLHIKISKYLISAGTMFNLWLLLDKIECSCTRESQERIYKWMSHN